MTTATTSPSFTKKHYQTIASSLAHDLSTAKQAGEEQLSTAYRIIAGLVTTFLKDNPAFDQQRFLTACDIPDEDQTSFVTRYLLDRAHQEPIVGWIAFYRGERLEIQRNELTDSLWQAKQVAIATLGIPKRDHGMLAIVPATAGEREDPGHGREG